MGNPTIVEYTLSQHEVDQIRAAAKSLAEQAADPAEPRFYDENQNLDRLLPSGLWEFLTAYRRSESAAVCLVHGLAVDDAAIGRTPTHWSADVHNSDIALQEYFLAMCGTALGDPYTWPTLQMGRMIQNLLPIRGDELRQSGYGSEALLEFHTEDGFHPGRCDYLLLFGTRNHDKVPTIVASVRDIELSDEDTKALREPMFRIRPDDEHLRQLRDWDPTHPALATVQRMHDDPVPVPVLFGDESRPYLRIDLPFMDCVGKWGPHGRALRALMAELERVQQSVIVEQGSLMVVDNYLAVHGRKSFSARHDGTDRWLKRMIVSRDLRKLAPYSLPESRRVVA